MRNCRDCDIIPDAETTDPVATSHVSPTHDTESAHFLSIPSVESETKLQSIGPLPATLDP